MTAENLPEGPNTIRPTLIIVGAIIAISALTICFFCSSCSTPAIKFFEKEVEQINHEINEELIEQL